MITSHPGTFNWPLLLEQACDPQRTSHERAARFKSLFDQLPARDDTSAPLHAQCLKAMLTPIDPVERRALLGYYHQRHRFQVRSDNTPRLFLLVSKLQKPEHRTTEHAWEELDHVSSPGRSTNWPVWRELCRVLASQMADVIRAFQQSGESPANKRRFNELVLRVVLRLAAGANEEEETAIARQFDLLSDLAQALPSNYRGACLRLLEITCSEWIETTRKHRPNHPIPQPVLGLEAALHLLRERYEEPAAKL